MNKETTFLHTLQNVTMSTGEKTRLRTELSLYADERPFVQSDQAPTFFSVLLESKRFPLYATLTALIVFGGGGSTLAAEGSAPGGTLYGIKIHVNEPLMSAFSPSEEGQARVSATRAARRVDEVVVLATTGRLTDEKQEYLETAFSREVETHRQHTDSLAKRGNGALAQEVQADFAVQLSAEAQALAAVSSLTPDKTKAFLRTVLAVSAGDDTEHAGELAQTDEIAGSTSDSEISSAVALLGSSTEATSTAKRKLSRTNKQIAERRSRTLFITASTSLTRLLETSSSNITPKTDRAITVEKTEQEKSGEELLFGK